MPGPPSRRLRSFSRAVWGLVWALCAFSVCLVLGLPLYGLVGVLVTGSDPLAGPNGLDVVVAAAGLGFLEALVLGALLWLGGRRWLR